VVGLSYPKYVDLTQATRERFTSLTRRKSHLRPFGKRWSLQVCGSRGGPNRSDF
jgi:hypothetical protein